MSNLKQKYKWIYFLILYFVLFGKIYASDKINSLPVYTEDQTNIIVKKNQPEFIIKLKSNPTTGYSWFLREYNAKHISLVKHQFEKPNTTLMGAGGHEIWIFRVEPAGFAVSKEAQIKLVYTRPWEPHEDVYTIIYKVNW